MSGVGNKTTLVYDFDLKAPACVLIQVAFGCADHRSFHHFDSRHWITHPTPGMRKIAGTDDEWRKAAEITRKHWGDKCPTGG